MTPQEAFQIIFNVCSQAQLNLPDSDLRREALAILNGLVDADTAKTAQAKPSKGP